MRFRYPNLGINTLFILVSLFGYSDFAHAKTYSHQSLDDYQEILTQLNHKLDSDEKSPKYQTQLNNQTRNELSSIAAMKNIINGALESIFTIRMTYGQHDLNNPTPISEDDAHIQIILGSIEHLKNRSYYKARLAPKARAGFEAGAQRLVNQEAKQKTNLDYLYRIKRTDGSLSYGIVTKVLGAGFFNVVFIDEKTGNYVTKNVLGRNLQKESSLCDSFAEKALIASLKNSPQSDSLPSNLKILTHYRKELAQSKKEGDSVNVQDIEKISQLENLAQESTTQAPSVCNRPSALARSELPPQNLHPVEDSIRKVNARYSHLSTDSLVHQLVFPKNPKDPAFPPESEVQVGGKHFYFSKRVQTGGRNFMIMYTQNDKGEDRARLIYRSKSDGSWKSTPGSEWEGRLLKGDEDADNHHYVQETLLHPELADFLNHNHAEILPENKKAGEYLVRNKFNILAQMQDHLDDKRSILDSYVEQKQVIDDPVLSKLLNHCKPGNCFGPRSAALGGNSASAYIANLNHQLQSLQTSNFIPDFKTPVRTYSSSHSLLSAVKDKTLQNDIQIQVFEGKYQGQLIEWHIAKDTKGRVWIDRIRPKDAKPNSFGNDPLVMTGILTNKPLEYRQQVIRLNPGEFAPFDSVYVDITPLLKKLLPIQEYCRIQGC
jgi:hypothetical protein